MRHFPFSPAWTMRSKTRPARANPSPIFVVGLAPDGGRLDRTGRQAVKQALEKGLNVDAGLHDYLSEDETLAGPGLEKRRAHPRYP